MLALLAHIFTGRNFSDTRTCRLERLNPCFSGRTIKRSCTYDILVDSAILRVFTVRYSYLCLVQERPWFYNSKWLGSHADPGQLTLSKGCKAAYGISDPRCGTLPPWPRMPSMMRRDHQCRNPMQPAVLGDGRTLDAFSFVARVVYVRTKPREAAKNAYTHVGHSTSFDFSAPSLAPPIALSLVAPIVCGLSVYAEHPI